MRTDRESATYIDEEPEAGRITVVAIDDQPTYVHGLATLLEDVAPDIEVLGVASDPIAGVDLVARHAPDVVLLDIHMPGLKGTDAATQIRSRAPDSAILFLTVSDELSDISEAMRTGARGYLFKDVQPEELVSAIRAVARGKVVLAPWAAAGLIGTNGSSASLDVGELQMFRLLAAGAGYADIAGRLSVSESTLKRQLAHALKKLNVDNKMQAIAYLARRGLL